MLENNLPEFKIGLKKKGNPSIQHRISNSKDVADLVRKCFDADTVDWVESFIVIGLSAANNVIGFYKVSQGGITGTVADPRVIMQFALLSNSVSLIIAHNHPSGSLRPSDADKILTQKIKGAAQLFEIKLLDHIIIAGEGYYSFADEGAL